MGKNFTYQEIFVGRQPIFDRKLNIYGYELLFRDADVGSANVTDGDVATSKVIVDGLTLAQRGVNKNIRFFINFPYNSLISGIAEVLPREIIVVEVLEDVIIDKSVLKTCIDLKKKRIYIGIRRLYWTYYK